MENANLNTTFLNAYLFKRYKKRPKQFINNKIKHFYMEDIMDKFNNKKIFKNRIYSNNIRLIGPYHREMIHTFDRIYYLIPIRLIRLIRKRTFY